jgi:hypothetical protein
MELLETAPRGAVSALGTSGGSCCVAQTSNPGFHFGPVASDWRPNGAKFDDAPQKSPITAPQGVEAMACRSRSPAPRSARTTKQTPVLIASQAKDGPHAPLWGSRCLREKCWNGQTRGMKITRTGVVIVVDFSTEPSACFSDVRKRNTQ